MVTTGHRWGHLRGRSKPNVRIVTAFSFVGLLVMTVSPVFNKLLTCTPNLKGIITVRERVQPPDYWPDLGLHGHDRVCRALGTPCSFLRDTSVQASGPVKNPSTRGDRWQVWAMPSKLGSVRRDLAC